MKKQILSEEFVRMQELAGIQSVNNENILVLEGIKIFQNIFSPGLVTEAKINIKDLTPGLIAFFKLLASTFKALDSEGDALLSDLLKYAIQNKDNKEEISQTLNSLNNPEENTNIKEAENEAPIIKKLRNYFMNKKIGKNVRNAMFTTVIAAMTLPFIYNTVKAISPKDVQTTIQTINVDSKLDADTGNTAYLPAEEAEIDAGSVGVELDDHSLVIPFKLAKGDMEGLKDPKILKNFVNTLKAKYSDPSLSGNITIKITGYASNDSGNSSDESSTSDEPLSKERAETIKNQIPKKIGKVNINIKTEQGDYNDLKKENPNSDNHIKGALGKIDIIDADIKQTESSSEEIPPTFIKTFQPLYDPKPKGGNKVRRTKPKQSDDTEGGSTPKDQVQDYLKYFPKLNRNGQLAVVLAVASPKTNIYKQLKLDTIKSFTDSELTAITDPNAKKIADLIINIRKNPNTLLKKISTATGIQLAPRAKAVQTTPGQKYQPSSPIQKTIAEVFSLVESLNEALVDSIFDELGISDADIKKNRVPLLSLVGSMYSNAGNNTISILDPKDLTPEEQDDLKGLGFSPQGAKGEYVFLQKDQTKKDVTLDKKQDQIKDKPDVIRVDDFIENNPTLKKKLNNINNLKELTDIIQVFIDQMAEKQPSKFGKPDQQLKLIQNLLNRLNPTVKEAEEVDTKDTNKQTTQPDAGAIEKIVRNSATWQNLFKNINDTEEATQLLLRIVGKFIDPIMQTSTYLKNSFNTVKKNISTKDK
jgi:hypothetical protein